MCTEEFIKMMFTVDLYGNRGLDSRNHHALNAISDRLTTVEFSLVNQGWRQAPYEWGPWIPERFETLVLRGPFFFSLNFLSKFNKSAGFSGLLIAIRVIVFE